MISIDYKGKNWSINKRYSDFEELMKQLRFHFTALPAIPSKSFFTLTKAKDIEERRKKLHDWLGHILKRTELFANDSFISFFQLEENAQDKLLNKICLVGRLSHPAFGYRDVLIQEDENIMFSLTSQMDTTSRVDSYITNKFVGKTVVAGKDHKMSVGALECWSKNASNSEEFTYQQVWVRAFKSQAICLHFCKSHNLLLIGCDNGDIVPIVVDPKNPEEYTEIKEYRLHSERVMAIWMDGDEKKIYSVGEDKKIVCFDFKTKSISSGKRI